MKLNPCEHFCYFPSAIHTITKWKDSLAAKFQNIVLITHPKFLTLRSLPWNIYNFFSRFPSLSKSFAPISPRNLSFRRCVNGSKLHQAAFYLQHHRLAWLLTTQQTPNIASQDKVTPLHVAAYKGNLEGIRLLLAAGALIEARDAYGQTPMHWAANKGHIAAINLLFIFGADIDARDCQNKTPLHMAVKQGHLDAASSFITLGADMEAKDHKKQTPYFIARLHGYRQISQYLADIGANTKVINSKGETAESVMGQACMQAYLRQMSSFSCHELDEESRQNLLSQIVMIA